MEEDEADLLSHLRVLERIVVIPSPASFLPPSLPPSLPPTIQSHSLEIERGFESVLTHIGILVHWHTLAPPSFSLTPSPGDLFSQAREEGGSAEGGGLGVYVLSFVSWRCACVNGHVFWRRGPGGEGGLL